MAKIKARVFLLKTFIVILSYMLCTTTTTSYVNGTLTDVDCLRSIKQSLEDPINNLSTWRFDNLTEGFICRFTGVDCWSIDESRILNIRLSDMGLKGQFPLGIAKCTSLTGLDLSKNGLTGPMPSGIHKILPYVTNLDLSFNGFSGEIPKALANCTYLSVLYLQNNRFSGQIPQRLGEMTRLKRFSFANNFLSGPVPIFKSESNPNPMNGIIIVTPETYANNTALCGGPLQACKKSRLEFETTFKLSFVIGFVVGWAISVVSVIKAFKVYNTRRDNKRGKNMKLTMPMTTALIVRRENKKKEATAIVEHGRRVNHGDENTRDEIIEEMNS